VNEDYSWKNKDYLIMDSVLLFEMRKLFKNPSQLGRDEKDEQNRKNDDKHESSIKL
jgi:hypothetical protein